MKKQTYVKEKIRAENDLSNAVIRYAKFMGKSGRMRDWAEQREQTIVLLNAKDHRTPVEFKPGDKICKVEYSIALKSWDVTRNTDIPALKEELSKKRIIDEEEKEFWDKVDATMAQEETSATTL